jgi:hypothetical protein
METKPKQKAPSESAKGFNGASNGHRVVLIQHKPQPIRAALHRQVPLATIYSVEEIQAVKNLCDRMGAENLLKLLDILRV